MLVLSRKVDQEIRIGDDITLTIVRINGNRVRIGIEAPQEVRIARGEVVASSAEPAPSDLPERQGAFAHPQPIKPSSPRLPAEAAAAPADATAAEPQLFTGRVDAEGQRAKLLPAARPARRPAPLASFVSAT